ncbi:Gfo/Idh/MocA family protein [Microbacterium tumbae]
MPLKIAVLGLDHWYAALPFARAVTAHPASELVVVVDADADRAREVAEELGVAWSTDFDAAIADASVDAVACFTSVDRSPSLCIAAARAGKHIVAVKPLAMTLREADAVVEAVDAAGVVFVPSEARRTSPLALALSEIVHSGSIGELVSGTFSMHSAVPAPWPGATGASWWTDPERAPGGGWIDHAVYQIDRMNWLFDSPIASVGGIVSNSRHSDLGVEDYGHAVFALASGAIVTVEDTWLGNGGDSFTSMHLVGRAGSVHADTRRGMLEVWRDGEWSSAPTPSDTFDTLDVLVRAVTEGARPPADVRSARQTLEICLRFYENAIRP